MQTPFAVIRVHAKLAKAWMAFFCVLMACSDDSSRPQTDVGLDSQLPTEDAAADTHSTLELGTPCSDDAQCTSGQCENLLFESVCTTDCTTTCPGQDLACFRGRCVPDSFCEDPFGTGLGEGPGCTGTFCDSCADNATCTENLGIFRCVCNPGFQGDGFKCSDVNECNARPIPCDFSKYCQQTPNGFVCNCPENLNRCAPDALCQNTAGSYICACAPGFVGEGFTCDDIDECALDADNCSPNGTCTNTRGAFQCTCNDGFTGNGVTCLDIDECTANLDNCSTNAECTNLPGAFVCTCKDGYEGNGTTCTDIHECATNTDNCSIHAVCINLPGSFSCGCGVGYTGDGVTCIDIDECLANTDECDTHADCENTPGFYTCTCRLGFTGNGFVCTENG